MKTIKDWADEAWLSVARNGDYNKVIDYLATKCVELSKRIEELEQEADVIVSILGIDVDMELIRSQLLIGAIIIWIAIGILSLLSC